MTNQYRNELSNVEKANNKLQLDINSLVTERGRNEKTKTEDLLNLEQSMRAMKEVKLFDPLDIANTIKTMAEELEQFQAEIDFALTEANATIFIEV